jgi:hypothetical protein
LPTNAFSSQSSFQWRNYFKYLEEKSMRFMGIMPLIAFMAIGCDNIEQKKVIKSETAMQTIESAKAAQSADFLTDEEKAATQKAKEVLKDEALNLTSTLAEQKSKLEVLKTKVEAAGSNLTQSDLMQINEQALLIKSKSDRLKFIMDKNGELEDFLVAYKKEKGLHLTDIITFMNTFTSSILNSTIGTTGGDLGGVTPAGNGAHAATGAVDAATKTTGSLVNAALGATGTLLGGTLGAVGALAGSTIQAAGTLTATTLSAMTSMLTGVTNALGGGANGVQPIAEAAQPSNDGMAQQPNNSGNAAGGALPTPPAADPNATPAQPAAGAAAPTTNNGTVPVPILAQSVAKLSFQTARDVCLILGKAFDEVAKTLPLVNGEDLVNPDSIQSDDVAELADTALQNLIYANNLAFKVSQSIGHEERD